MTRIAAIKVLSVLAILCAATLIVLVYPVGEWLDRLLSWVRGLGLWGPVVFSVVYMVATVLFVPASWLTIGAGYAFGIVVGTFSALVGALLGASVAFVLGRTLARQAIERGFATSARFRALDRGVAEQGFKIVFLVRLTPVLPFAPLNYALGVTAVRFRDFLLASCVGMLPGALTYAYLGWVTQNVTQVAMGESERSPFEWALLVVGLLATVAVTVLVTRLARRALRDAATETEGVFE